MDKWNREQHGKSGLIDRVKESTVSESEAMNLTINFCSSGLIKVNRQCVVTPFH